MKYTIHFNGKNLCSVIAAVCVLFLAYIPLTVPPDHWAWMRWSITVCICVVAAILALFYQAHLQSKEEDEREEREKKRDKFLADLQLNNEAGAKQTTPSTVSSNAMTRSIPHSPGSFDSVEYFRVAYMSPLQDPAANSFRVEAERVRPNDKESFYLDVLATGSVKIMYDELWWTSYRSQIKALTALVNHNGILPFDKFKAPFDEAAIEFADDYNRLNIKLDNWMNFLKENQLVIVHPSNMVEVTVKGKDFLKYLLHNGRPINEAKRL